MTEANNDNWSREGENADFSMEDFWLPFVADDGAGAVVGEVLEIAPREVFLTFIFAACGLLWSVPHMICQARRMKGDKIWLQGILRHIFLRLRCDLSEGFDTHCLLMGNSGYRKKFEWIAAHERAAYPQTF